MKYKVGDKVQIKSLDWYNENKDSHGNVLVLSKVYRFSGCEKLRTMFTKDMAKFCGKVVTIETVWDVNYSIVEGTNIDYFTDEMIEGLVERNGKTYPYKIGDRVILVGTNRGATITDLKYNSSGNLSYYIKIDNDKDISVDYPTELLLPYDTVKELVEEETKFGTASNPVEPKSNANCLTRERVDETKHEPKFKVGDKIISYVLTTKDDKGWKVIDVERTGYKLKSLNNSGLICDMDFKNEHYYKLVEEETKPEPKFKVGDRVYSTTWQRDVIIQEIIPNCFYKVGDINGLGWFTTHETSLCKEKLEKVNTLKTQNDNMETQTHRGYYTTEEETTNKSKKVAWLTFGDHDFADKVELDLSNRELIQEDGKWFAVKKKKEYPKTYAECCKVLGLSEFEYNHTGTKVWYRHKLMATLDKLMLCRDAYWKIAGEERALGKPWEPDYTNIDEKKFSIWVDGGKIKLGGAFTTTQMVLSFPTEEMRDAFKKNFDPDIEICKKIL